MSKRRLKNWLVAYGKYTQHTETPRHFWLWSGINVIAGALGRKVWIPFGRGGMYPNMYIFIVAPPGRCRKGAAIDLAKDLLTEANKKVGADSTTRAKLIEELSDAKEIHLDGSKPYVHTSYSIASKELASLLTVDKSSMLEALTDLYDSHKDWIYETKGGEQNKINAPCLNLIAATTPTWLARNLPVESIGDGFLARVIMVTAKTRPMRITIPSYDRTIYNKLKSDLEVIGGLYGKFEFSKEGYEFYDHWYQHAIDKYISKVQDDRFVSFLDRLHIMCMKVAMVVHVSKSNSLVLEREDFEVAIELLEDLLPYLSDAYGGLGAGKYSQATYQIIEQIKLRGKMTFKDIVKVNWKDIDVHNLTLNIIPTIEHMEEFEVSCDGEGMKTFKWKG